MIRNFKWTDSPFKTTYSAYGLWLIKLQAQIPKACARFSKIRDEPYQQEPTNWSRDFEKAIKAHKLFLAGHITWNRSLNKILASAVNNCQQHYTLLVVEEAMT